MKARIIYLPLLFLLCLTCEPAAAQQPALEWTQRYNGTDSTSDQAIAIAVDAEGNSYVTGTSYSLGLKTNTVKYSPAGEQLWVAQFGGEAGAIAIDNKGGVYVTGYSSGADYDVYYATVRYDAATGEQAWVQRYNWPEGNFDVPKAIAVDKEDGVYVTGFSATGDTYDYATVRYEATTGEESWARRYDGSGGGSDIAWAIAVDNNGGVYVTGSSDSASTDYLTIRYDAATGNEVWTSRYDGPSGGSDGGTAIAVDNKGGIYVTGDSEGHYATLRYDAASGKQAWVKRFNAYGHGNETPRAIAVDNFGGVYVTGYSYGETARDYVTVRYKAATGEESWARRYDGPDEGTSGDDVAVALAVDNAGGVYVTGYSGNGTYYPCEDVSCTTYDFATVRYATATGEQSWVQRYEGPESATVGDGYAVAITVDQAGGVYVAGSGYERSSSYNYVTIRYTASSGEVNWARRYSGVSNTDDFTIAVAADAQGNSYVAGTSSNRATTIKYSPAGEQLWVAQFGGEARAIAVDNKGGVYVTGFSYVATDDNRTNGADYTTVRYDAATGEQTWMSHYNAPDGHPNFPTDDFASAIALDNTGGVYVTGHSGTSDYGFYLATVRYTATTGEQTWSSKYKGNEDDSFRYDVATAIAVDNKGGVYVTGSSLSEASGFIVGYVTLRYEAATGGITWVSPYDSPDKGNAQASGIAVDEMGGIYVTGSNGGDYLTFCYEAATGRQIWASRYKGESSDPEDRNKKDGATAIAVDTTDGLYVTGTSNNQYATLRYKASTGEQVWVSRYGENGGEDVASAIAVDNAGGVYVTGVSESGDSISMFGTLKYAAADGAQLWDVQTAGPEDGAVDMALDASGNVIVTGYSFSFDTGYDFLTLKYSQENTCTAMPGSPISGYTTVSSGFVGATYSLSAPGARTFAWQITDPDGNAYTAFTGQGTSSISVDWPAEPEAYKMSVTYSGHEGCPSQTSVLYIHVYAPAAGFVTGGGWSDSPTHPDYELMQQGGRAYWGFGAKYRDKDSDRVQGTLLLVLESGTSVFCSTALEEGSLVIADGRAYFRGTGTLTYRGSGGLETDGRRFAYLVSAVDGQGEKPKEEDKLRLRIWVINEDGSPGETVYDNQVGCPSANLDHHAEACAAIDKGSIVIHKHGIGSLVNLFALSAAEGPQAQGLKAYPTAFSDRTTLSFATDFDSDYALELYDLKGALVKRLAAGATEAGKQNLYELRADDLAKGLYLARLTIGDNVQTVKLVVQR
jgi:hypothetical protein